MKTVGIDSYDPRVSEYFNRLIHEEIVTSTTTSGTTTKSTKPRIYCDVANETKGKAIFAESAMEAGQLVWMEKPFVAMQHEVNKLDMPCCQQCFMPLNDFTSEWQRVITMLQETKQLHSELTIPENLASEDMASVLQMLRHQYEVLQEQKKHQVKEENEEKVSGSVSFLQLFDAHGAKVTCEDCDVVYCSSECREIARIDHHALLCSYSKRSNTQERNEDMDHFVEHTLATNEIFQLAAKVMAKCILRFIELQSVASALEPVDMFCKLPWWDVVTSEEDLEPDQTMEEYKDCFRHLLGRTFGLLMVALEKNLFNLQQQNQLNGLSVESVLQGCHDFLHVEFFACVVGMFEMNNISMEVDHPFMSLQQLLQDELCKGELAEPEQQVASRVVEALELYQVLTEEEDDDEQGHGCCDHDGHHHSHGHGHDHGSHGHEGDDEEEEKEDEHSSHKEVVEAAQEGEEENEEESEGLPIVDGTALFSVVCTMNHSCEPNCTVIYTKNHLAHVFAIRDIKKGEELCIAYIDVMQPVDARQEALREYQFECTCTRCVREQNE